MARNHVLPPLGMIHLFQKDKGVQVYCFLIYAHFYPGQILAFANLKIEIPAHIQTWRINVFELTY